MHISYENDIFSSLFVTGLRFLTSSGPLPRETITTERVSGFALLGAGGLLFLLTLHVLLILWLVWVATRAETRESFAVHYQRLRPKSNPRTAGVREYCGPTLNI
ncbi:MAG: hypothetical protein KTU85_05590 [Acidimicrobiia bacterium]|nr:hypothetical protein [Acidimicrobiia bacterium]MCY4458720.1 hypothetical protein [Acidimicrobiaceae bacterium]